VPASDPIRFGVSSIVDRIAAMSRDAMNNSKKQGLATATKANKLNERSFNL
jgi:hypothetical protein